MSGAPGSYLKNFSAQNLTVLPQIVVVNKYSLWVSVCLCVWSTDRQPIAIWNCQEGTAAKARRNIRVIFLRHGKKFPFLPLSPCVWGSHNLELHLIHGAVCREPHRKPSVPKEGATTPPNRDTFLSDLHWTALPVQEKMFPYSWTNAHRCSPGLYPCANWEGYKTKSSVLNKELFHTSRCSCSHYCLWSQ